MPYIKSGDGRREALQRGEPALTAGELNYQIFYFIKHHLYRYENVIKKFIKQFLGKNPNYQKYNDMTGCLIRCYKELERRLGKRKRYLIIDLKSSFESILNFYDNEIAKYEDKKIQENGDIE